MGDRIKDTIFINNVAFNVYIQRLSAFIIYPKGHATMYIILPLFGFIV
jgi:hypothetical protein